MSIKLSTTAQLKKFIKKYKFTPKKESNKKSSIIIILNKSLIALQICIESIKKFTNSELYEIIVIDNSLDKENFEWLSSQEDLIVIKNVKTENESVCFNLGTREAKNENLVFLSEDVIVTPNWLNKLIDRLYSDDEVIGVCASSNSYLNKGYLGQINTISDLLDIQEEISKKNNDKFDYLLKFLAPCYMVKRSFIDKVFFDENFIGKIYAFDDLAINLICAGYKIVLAKDTFIYSFDLNKEVGNIEMVHSNEKDKKYFIEKRGFDSTIIHSRTKDISNFIEIEEKEALNILICGCEHGEFATWLKNKNKNSDIYGIDICNKFSSFLKGNLEFCEVNQIISNLPFANQFFDLIVIEDFIEKLINPTDFLIDIKRILKSKATLIMSINNFNHINNIKNLTKGMLIENQEHIYTFNNIQDLMLKSGIGITSINGVAYELSKEDSDLIDTLSIVFDSSIRQQYSIVKYIVKAEFNNQNFSREIYEKLKLKLIRIDSNIEIEESVKSIIAIYDNYDFPAEFLGLIINEECLDKDVIYKNFEDACESLNRKEFLKILKGDVNEES